MSEPTKPCVVCHRQNDSPFKICDECRSLRNERRQQRKAAGRCVDCSRKTDGKIRCVRCREKITW